MFMYFLLTMKTDDILYHNDEFQMTLPFNIQTYKVKCKQES